MGPDADQANVLLLTFKTKIEEAISLVNQMPEDLRQEAWHFWQKVSTAIRAATIGIKKRKPVPGGKEIIPRRRKTPKKKVPVNEQSNDEETVEQFIVDSPIDAIPVPATLVSDLPVVGFGQDTLPQDFKLFSYNAVYTKETTNAVEAMIASNEAQVVIDVKDSNSLVVSQGGDGTPSGGTETINVVVQDFVNDEVITSLVTIDNPPSPYKSISPHKPSPKKRQCRKGGSKRKSRKKDPITESSEEPKNDETSAETAETAGGNTKSTNKTPRKRQPRKKKGSVPVSEDAISQALAENLELPQSENINSGQKSDVDTEIGETPLAENKSANTKSKKPRRSSRPPKPKKLPVDQADSDEAPEGGDDQVRKRRVYLPGEPKPDLGPVNCEVCGVQLAFISSLAAHMRKHTGDRPFVCGICKKPFTTKANMLRHEKTHSGEKPFQCEICQKCFTEKKTLKVHMRSHTGERPFKCPECGIGFSQSGTLKTHMHRHSGHKGNLCDLCGRAFRQKSQLRLHLKRHFNLKAYKCEKCDQTFYCKGDLSRHEMRHTGERPFACSQCPKTFTRVQYLKEHENQHNGVTPYNCELCSIRFSDHSSFYRHMHKHKKSKSEHQEDSVHLVVDSEMMANEAMDSVPALLVTADHIQHLLGVNTANSGEVYRIALVDQTVEEEEAQIVQDPTQVDFSAINLLASATTQLSMSQETESDLKQIVIPQLLN